MKYLSDILLVSKKIIWLFLFLSLFFGQIDAQPSNKKIKNNQSKRKQPQRTNSSTERTNQPMTFRIINVCEGKVCPSFILAEGVIAAETPKAFRIFLTSLKGYYAPVYFNSPGGNLYAGLQLGSLIRKANLDTVIGSDYLEETDMDSEKQLPARPICFSACAYAFMGGRIRVVSTVGKLGVHQFKSLSGKNTESSTQVTMAVLGNYFDKMGVDRQVLDIAAVTEPQQISLFSVDEAKNLKLDNSEPPLARWTLQSFDDGKLYLSLLQETSAAESMYAFFITRIEGHYLITLRYSIKQNLRSRKELKEIFTKEMKETVPTICSANTSDGICVNETLVSVFRTWNADENGIATIGLKLTKADLVSLSNSKFISFDAEFPMVYIDIEPSITISTRNLGRLINALENSR